MNTNARATVLPDVVAAYIEAVNAFDVDAVMATFSHDAVVNDARREFADSASIRAWVSREIVGDKVTMDVTEVAQRGTLTIVRARYDGEYDKTNLPDELVLTSYLTVADGTIGSLVIVHNEPSPY
ncbi:nuclear transport factor 2 family protein [Kitasatospora viridis]|uniref:SnoaL-like protein n=1 Tax=Kitasatospora viridis TaxID=281105 RepID=A0A561TV85_9ACTN|nr:nuclear transport factor 2 family protein [Kitasatospora viridis]TWF91020.1 SnoaL-like protein [Kitasatospora viridis]